MDLVGVGPESQLSGYVYPKRIDGKAYSSNLTLSTIFSLRTLAHIIKSRFEKKDSQTSKK
jgi:hypothetical protein